MFIFRNSAIEKFQNRLEQRRSPVQGAHSSRVLAEVSRLGELWNLACLIAPGDGWKFVSAGRQNQHAGRVRSSDWRTPLGLLSSEAAFSRSPSHCVFAFFCTVALTVTPLYSADDHTPWAVPTAELRLKAQIISNPSEPSAGIVAEIQNGGLLPQPSAEAVVLDSDGKELKNECIWNNPREGMAIVFEPPTSGAKEVWIYLKSASAVSVGTAQSRFHPGLLLYTEVGKASLPAARALAQERPPGRSGRMGIVSMVADRYNRFGASQNYISYYSGWLNVKQEGAYWCATISQDGSTAVIDGRTAADWPGRHEAKEGKSGEMGRSVTLAKGIHRFEYFHFNVDGNPFAQFVWRLPGVNPKEPLPTPRDADFLQSGKVRIVDGENRSGAPLALFEKRALSTMGFGEHFIDLFELSSPLARQFPDATFTWKWNGGYEVNGPRILWPVVRGEAEPVTLMVSSIKGSSTGSRLIYPDVIPRGAKVTSVRARRRFCEALANQAKATPKGHRPAENWPECFWLMLPEIIEPGEGWDLLSALLPTSLDNLRNVQDFTARTKLEEIYLEEICKDPKRAVDFFNGLVSQEKDPARRFRWQSKQIDFYLYEMGDTKTARQLSDRLQVDPFHAGPHDAALRLLLLGDIERLDGNLDKAQQLYGAAQQEYVNSSKPAVGLGSPTLMDRPLADYNAKAKRPAKEGVVLSAATGANADWRKRTVRQNAFYADVNSQLDQGYFAEAKATLNAWELEFPLSKLTGDYPLAEARYYYLCGNLERAIRILKAYRKQVDLTNELPQTMRLEMVCLFDLKRTEDLKELATDIKKRFPDLPLAAEMDAALNGTAPKTNKHGDPEDDDE